MPKQQRKKYIKIALDKSYHLEELINELFAITKYHSKGHSLHHEQINLNLMLEQIIDDFYPMLEEQHKHITINYPKQITILADSHELARAFSNLIKNAINYSLDKSIITINLTINHHQVTTTICNPINSISKVELDHIFDKFYRLDKSRASSTGGSGLGLAIAKEIIELHQGTITVNTNSNQIIFTINLPLSLRKN